MTVNLKEFLSAYLAEVDEHVGAANARLLAIEAAAQGGARNARAVRDLFRALHTVKGLSAMVGVDPVVAIAHDMEAAVRAADRAGGDLPAAWIEPLLEGLRAIEICLRAVASGEDPPAAPRDLLERLEELGQRDPARAAPAQRPTLELDPAVAAKLAPFELAQLDEAGASGARAVRVDFVPSAERSAAGFTIGSVRERASAIAEIVKIVPIASPISAARPGGLSFAMLLVTKADDAAIAQAVGVDVAQVATLSTAGDGSAPVGGAAALSASADASDEAPASMSLDLIPEDPPPARHRAILRVEVGRVDDAMERVSALIVTRSRLARAVAAVAERGVDVRELMPVLADNARQLRDLRAAILKVRMVAAAEVFERLPLLVRGLCRTTGKRVKLELETGLVELDKAVAERLMPAIVHLVRNAVDHGIEAPDERVRRGKPEIGTLRVACVARSNRQISITLSDDGRGIDPVAVARRSGREAPDSRAQLLDILCEPGLSTRTEVTETSGRGMGMDIVRRVAVDQLGGDLTLDTTFGEGTSFTLVVPLTVSIVDAFTLQCAAHRFVVPVSHVDEILDVTSTKMLAAPGRARGRVVTGVIERRGEAIPFVPLLAAFAAASTDRATLEGEERLAQAVVVRRGGEAIAFGLDRVVGQQEAVVRPLLDPLVQVPGVTGSTDLGDGRATLVLDLAGLGAALAKERAA